MPLQVTIGYGVGQNSSNTNLRYTLNGSEPGEDSFIFLPGARRCDLPQLRCDGQCPCVRPSTDLLRRTFESDVASVTYASTTPKVATPIITPARGKLQPGPAVHHLHQHARRDHPLPYRRPRAQLLLSRHRLHRPHHAGCRQYELTARGYKDGYYKSDAAYSGPIDVNAIQLPGAYHLPQRRQLQRRIDRLHGQHRAGRTDSLHLWMVRIRRRHRRNLWNPLR